MKSLFESLSIASSAWLGQILGNTVAILLSFLVLYLIWILPWQRILQKAGYTGKFYWLLLMMVCSPLLLFSIAMQTNNQSIVEMFSSIGALVWYLGFFTIAFSPWSVCAKVKQFKEQHK